MHVTVRDQKGRLIEGVLLAASPRSLRLILRESRDTLELTLVSDRWRTENGETLEIELWNLEPSEQIASFFSGFSLPAGASPRSEGWN